MAPAIKGVKPGVHLPFWNINTRLTLVLCKENAQHTRHILLVDANEHVDFPDEVEVLQRNGVKQVVARTSAKLIELVIDHERTVFLLNAYPVDIDELTPKVDTDGEFVAPGARLDAVVKPLLESGKSCLRVYSIQ